jgi:hypothetical protein
MKDKKIGIICNLMTSYGGVQVCVIELVKALNKKGYTPTLITDTVVNEDIFASEKLDWNIRQVDYSLSRKALTDYKTVISRVREFAYYFRSSWLQKEFDFLFFFQHNIIIDDKTKHLCYLSNSPITHYAPNPFLHKLKVSFYKIFIKWFIPVFEFNNYNSVINSKFTAGIYHDFYQKRLDVVYPPNALGYPSSPIVKDDNSCIILSRIERPKRMELALEMAKKYPEICFRIVGGVTPESLEYFNFLKETVKNNSLLNVEFHENVKYEKNIELLSKSKYYLFLAQNEHFGITTVEAINYNCVPIVHNSGGQKEIVPIEELRFSNENLESVFNSVISKTDAELNIYQNKLKKHADKFATIHYTEALITRMENQL